MIILFFMDKILIIKTGYSEFLEQEIDSRRVSLGDVFRSTVLLNLYKNEHVTWVTDKKASFLLEDNPFINRLVHLDWIAAEHLKKERFDTIINLEKVPGIGALVENISSVRNFGFRFDPNEKVSKPYDHAFNVLSVSSDPILKKSNRKTAQELLFEMVKEKWKGEEYILGYKPQTKEVYDVALNILVGQKWPTKLWPSDNWDKLELMLKSNGFSVTRQDKQGSEIFESMNKYIDWINQSKLVVSNDSLGLHLALALKKKVLGLFGPTPDKEVYFYGRGKAILPEPYPDCAPCFKPKCEKEKNCMEDISPERVYTEVCNLLK